MAATRIHRITMFKIPDAKDQETLLDAYKTLAKEQQKDGKPYILFMCAGAALPDERSRGFTVVGKTEFASLEDMRYYDNECAAHAALRKTVFTLGVTEPPLSIYFEGAALISL